MEPFIESLVGLIKAKRDQFAAEGLEGDALTDATAQWFNAIMAAYYGKLMAAMTESDYQSYRAALEVQNAEVFDALMAKYEPTLVSIRQEIIELAKN